MKKFVKFIPIHPKRYLLGIDIGNATLKIAGMSVDDKKSLLFSAVMDITRNRDSSFLKEAIQGVIKEYAFPSKDAILTFSDESTMFRRTELPVMPQKEILDALRWKAKEAVLFDVYNASIAYRVIGETQKSDGAKMMEVLYVVVSKDAIERAIAVLRGAGLNAVGVNVMPFGIEHIVSAGGLADATKAVVVVDFGYTKTEVSVFRNNRIEFVRSIPFGSKAITDAMQEPLLYDNREVVLTQAEAEKIKRDIGIAYEEVVLDNGISSTQILSLSRSVLEHFSKEIRRSVEYYSKEFGGEGSVEILLTGGGSRLKNIGRYLSEEMDVHVGELAMPVQIDASGTNLGGEDLAETIGLIGVLSGFEKQANLLPVEHKAEKVEFIEALSLRMMITTAAIVLLLYYAFMEFSIYNYRSRLTNIPLQRSVFAQIKAIHEQVAERERFLALVKASGMSEEYLMKELSNVVPREVVLSSLGVNERGKVVEIRGIFYGPNAATQDCLTKFMEDLERSKYFKDAQLVGVQVGKAGTEDASDFELIASLE